MAGVPHLKNKSNPQGLAFCFLCPASAGAISADARDNPPLGRVIPGRGCLTQKTKATRRGLLFDFFISPPHACNHAAAINKKTSAFDAGFLGGAKDGIRTRDPDLGKVVLYQLSYFRSRATKIERKQTSTSILERKFMIAQNGPSSAVPGGGPPWGSWHWGPPGRAHSSKPEIQDLPIG